MLVETLRMAIYRGDLTPGQRLIEAEVAGRYHASRGFHVALVPGRPAQGLKEHLAIVEAVCSRDPDAAEEAMREHLFNVIEALRQLAVLGPSPLMPLTALG